MKNENLLVSKQDLKAIIEEMIDEKLEERKFDKEEHVKEETDENVLETLREAIKEIYNAAIEEESQTADEQAMQIDEEYDELEKGYIVLGSVNEDAYIVAADDDESDVSICSHSLLCELALAGLIDNAEVDVEQRKIHVYID